MRGIGGCIGLIVVGAILTFASDWQLRSVNLDLVGVIMMVAGVIGLAVYASVAKRRRTAVLPVAEEPRRGL
ncbi:hypothetical protein OG389_26170 [Streptomyces sp. NBC_00435]|uniref:hypothetical protein n=1 Tax=Streptomyces sp. NBC_00435 TaxID=2903649 RepID=UPI002E1C6130